MNDGDLQIAPSKVTDATGKVSWAGLEWGEYVVQETIPPTGYDLTVPAFQSFEVNATHLTVSKSFENPRKKGSVEVTKRDETDTSILLAGATFQLWTDINGNGVVDGADAQVQGDLTTTTPSGMVQWENLDWGHYVVKETVAPSGYSLSSPATQAFEVRVDNADTIVALDFDNPRIPGTATWSKVHVGTSTLLGGSEWTLTGPGVEPVTGVIVEDCVAATAAECVQSPFHDQDPAAGKFLLTGLAWGAYTIVEAKAPPGYVLDDTAHVLPTIDAAHLDVSIELAIPNTPVNPPSIPLTGGLGRDFFTILGFGILVLAAGAFGVMQYRTRHQEV